MPDPDAIGSAYGLQQLFRQLGIEASLCYDGNIDKLSAAKMLKTFNIVMFSKIELAGVLNDDDCIICVDSQPYGGNITDLTGIEIATIDHHPVVEKTLNTEYVFKDIRKVGACCSIITEYFTLMEKEPDTATATALLHGIKMDTLNPMCYQIYNLIYCVCNSCITNSFRIIRISFHHISKFFR